MRQRVFIRKHAFRGHAYVEEADPRENPDDFSGWYIPESDALAAVRRGVESGTIEGTEHKGWLVIRVPDVGEDR